MPRGRPRKVDPEILPSEEDQPKRGRKQLVEAEHTIKYTSPVPVTVEEPEDAELELLDEDLKDRPKRKKNTEREELRKKLMAEGVTPASPLKLIIERYLHSESADSGTMAEKEYCTKYFCNEAHILSQDYLDVASKWGPGRYWFTLYMKFAIVTQWEKKLGAVAQSHNQPVIQHSIPGDPTSPQVIVQMPQGDGQHQAVVFDPVKAMKEQTLAFKQQLENYKLMRDVFGPVVEHDKQAGNPADPDTTFVQTLLTDNTKLKEKLSNGLIGQIFGNKAVDDDPSWGAVVMKAIEKGEVSKSIDSIGRVAISLLDMILPKRDNNNGQAQMGQAPLQNMQPNRDSIAEGVPQSGEGVSPSVIESSQSASMGQTENVSPEDQALQLIIDHCQKNLPAQVAFDRLMAYADAVNAQYPQGSIDTYIFDYLGKWETDAVLAFVKALPNGEAVTSLPHCREWTESLQKLIRESQEDGE